MTPLDAIVIGEVGGFVLVGAGLTAGYVLTRRALDYAREAVEHNWVKGGFSIATPDARLMKLTAPAQAAPEPAAEPAADPHLAEMLKRKVAS